MGSALDIGHFSLICDPKLAVKMFYGEGIEN
jgi:hypothetical protein